MKCVKCGTELEEGARFCGNCGNSVEPTTPAEEKVVEEEKVEEPVAEEPKVEEPVEQPEVAFASEVSSEPQERQEIVQEPIPVDTKEFKDAQAKGKKSKGAIKWILISAIVLFVVAIGLFLFFFVFDKQTYEQSIQAMNKSIENLSKKLDKSGTISAKVELSVKNEVSLKLGADLEYELKDDTYLFHTKVDKTQFFDKIEAYVKLSTSNIEAYMPYGVLTEYGDYYGDEDYDDDEWVKFAADIDDLEDDDEFITFINGLSAVSSTEDKDIDISSVFTEKNFKYSGRKGLLKKYTLTIDKDYIKSLVPKELSSDMEDELDDFKFDIDFYIDGSDCLNKIQIDLKKIFKEITGESVDKFLITINFTKLNKTKVEIPKEIKNNAKEIKPKTPSYYIPSYGSGSSKTPISSNGKAYKLGDTFTFDNLKITLDKNYTFTTVTNSYSEYAGSSVIKLGVTIENVGTEKNHLGMFDYQLFGSKGTELKDVATYFYDEDAVDYAGDLKPGASYKVYFYILYDGDGKYSIDFDNYEEEASVEFDIAKSI